MHYLLSAAAPPPPLSPPPPPSIITIVSLDYIDEKIGIVQILDGRHGDDRAERQHLEDTILKMRVNISDPQFGRAPFIALCINSWSHSSVLYIG